MNSKPSLPARMGAHFVLGLAALVVLFPVYAVVLMSLSRAPGFSVALSPSLDDLTLVHFSRFLGLDTPGRFALVMRQLVNSLVVAGGTTVIGVFLAASAAYALSRFEFPGKGRALGLFVVVQMFPGTMMMVPLYLLVSRLGLLDSLAGLAVVYATTSLPFCVWMLKGYFDQIPRELDEAALMDGASTWTIFYRIALPLARPALAVTALFSFLTAWNEFILAATFVSKEELFTLPVALNRLVSAYGADWGAFAAGSILVSLPVCALFFALQRQLVAGLTSGAVK